ncbi:hypothetical protein THIX_60823 [Thiomonas sp. X19]|nr:hypothetical protein THIX_60823 [Thiomonas sp. X19]
MNTQCDGFPMSTQRVDPRLSAEAVPCQLCPSRSRCGLLGLLGDARGKAQTRIQVETFRAGAPILIQPSHLYAVRSGAVKSVWNDAVHQSSIIDLCFPGQLFALESLIEFEPLHREFKASMSMTSVCSVACNIKGKSRASKELCGRVSAALATRLLPTYQLTHVIQSGSQVRVAYYMMKVMHADATCNSPGHRILPNIPRADIADYLRLRVETVSRVFSAFRKQGWIRGQVHRIDVVDPEAIKAVAGQLGEAGP